MTNYENFIIEMLTELDVVKHQEEIKEHINRAYCFDRLTEKKREEYLQYLEYCIMRVKVEEEEFHKNGMTRILQRQEEQRKKMEYKEACKILFSSIGKRH